MPFRCGMIQTYRIPHAISVFIDRSRPQAVLRAVAVKADVDTSAKQEIDDALKLAGSGARREASRDHLAEGSRNQSPEFPVVRVLRSATWSSPRCLIPGFDGAIFSTDWKDALWARFSMGAPRRQRRSVERYSIVKRA